MQPEAVRRTRGAYSTRLRASALVLPSALLAALIGLEHFYLEATLPQNVAHLVTLAIGVAGVLVFSTVIFARLTELHEVEVSQGERLAQLARDLESRSRKLQVLNEAGITLAAELDPSTVLQSIAELARSVGNARYSALGVFDEEGRVLQFITAGITEEQRRRIGVAHPEGKGILGLLQRDKRPLRLRDLKQHPASVPFPPQHPPMTSFLGVPILFRGQSLGNLYLTEKEGADEFTAEDESALLTLAAQAAIAIENARLYSQAERVSALEERQRIGMDLHDGAIQSLYGLGLMLEDVAERVMEEPVATRTTLHRAVDRLNATIADLRSYVLGLAPVGASDQPLREALPRLAEQVASNALLHVDLDVAPDADNGIDQAAREAAYFVAADSLANIARHARARNAWLRLAREDGQLVLDVRDDGVGFDTTSVFAGMGLRNMRERAFQVGGRLDVTSAPGRGTRIQLRIPLRTEVAA